MLEWAEEVINQLTSYLRIIIFWEINNLSYTLRFMEIVIIK